MVDFQELKTRFTFEEVVKKLGLELKVSNLQFNQWRGECPVCKGDKRTLVVTENRGFYCFGAKAGGDQLALIQHIRNCSVKEAAEWLAGTQTPATVPQGDNETKKLAPLSYLEHSHEAVAAIGFNTDFAKKHGIGFARKGLMRGTVAIPFRDESGTLLGYIGLTDPVVLPNDFT